MPNLNVKGESGKAPSGASGGGGGSSKLVLYLLLAVFAFAGIAFVLNTTGVVKLWGKKKAAPVVVDIPIEETYEPPVQQNSPLTNQTETTPSAAEQPGENSTVVQPHGMKSPEPKQVKIKTSSEISGTGMFTVQIASFTSAEKANKLAAAYADAGYSSFVQHANGYFSVCIGRYESRASAKQEGEKLVPMLENNYAVVKVQ